MVQVTPHVSQQPQNLFAHAQSGESITTSYQDLLDSFLEDENTVSDATPPKTIEAQKEPTKVEPKKIEPTKVQETTQYSPPYFTQLVKEQVTAIEQRLISIQNTASRASTNASRIEKDLKHNLPSNLEMQALFSEQLQNAYNMRGENLGLVTSYKQSLTLLNPYIKMMQDLNAELEKTAALLLKIESTTDIIFADIDSATTRFAQSLTTHHIVNDFSKPIDAISSLLKSINESEETLDSFSRHMEKIAKKLERRKMGIIFYMNGPQDPYLEKKDPQEFEDELDLIESNLEVLKINQILVPTFNKTKASIATQLKNLETFAKELHTIQSSHFSSTFGKKNPQELEKITYNGTRGDEYFHVSEAKKV